MFMTTINMLLAYIRYDYIVNLSLALNIRSDCSYPIALNVVSGMDKTNSNYFVASTFQRGSKSSFDGTINIIHTLLY